VRAHAQDAPCPPALDSEGPPGYRLCMAQLEIDVLSKLADELAESAKVPLTPYERAEVLRIARGFACKDSAAAASISPETIRARRKRIYRKLGTAGAIETLSALLALSLRRMASAVAPVTEPPAAKSAGVQQR
jgi:DNA-binding CsgD family transcriptional regulator